MIHGDTKRYKTMHSDIQRYKVRSRRKQEEKWQDTHQPAFYDEVFLPGCPAASECEKAVAAANVFSCASALTKASHCETETSTARPGDTWHGIKYLLLQVVAYLRGLPRHRSLLTWRRQCVLRTDPTRFPCHDDSEDAHTMLF